MVGVANIMETPHLGNENRAGASSSLQEQTLIPLASTVILVTPVVDEAEKWARIVEMFNKIKRKAFIVKVNATKAMRWKDEMEKVFDILQVSEMDQQKFAVFNIQGSA